jgi:GT2 family glycosyltransferase
MRNLGVREARGRFLCFLDDDCLAPNTLLHDMERILRTRKAVGAVGCRVVACDATFWNRCADQALFTAYQAEKEGETAGLGSAALAVRREAFEAAGGFDEQLLASEDWDFSLKIRAGGWLCWFSPEIAVLHDHRRGNFKAILQSAWKYGKASGLTVQRRHRDAVSWVARMMLMASKYKIYWLLMLPYSCFLTVVWLLEARPGKLLPCLPVIFLARLWYQLGVFSSLQKEV